MKTYIISDLTIEDSRHYETHKSDAEAAVARYGGRYLVRTSDIEVLEGECDTERLVIIEFPDEEQARAFYHSAEYGRAKAVRQASAKALLRLAPACE